MSNVVQNVANCSAVVPFRFLSVDVSKRIVTPSPATAAPLAFALCSYSPRNRGIWTQGEWNLSLRVAVVNQRYDPEVQNPSGFLGNNVLMRCNVPSFVRDHVTVTSWLQEPAFNIYPSTMGGKQLKKQNRSKWIHLHRITGFSMQTSIITLKCRIILFSMKQGIELF